MRRLLVAVDDSDVCEEAVKWVMAHLYREGDEVHLLHVVPRLQMQTALYGAPPVDFLPYQDPHAYEQLIRSAEEFIATRALAHMGGLSPQPVVHIVKYEADADSIGNVICRKAEELSVAAVAMARHSKSKLQEFFLGSVTNYVLKHCKAPVVIYHT